MPTCVRASHVIENLQEKRKFMMELYMTINLKVSWKLQIKGMPDEDDGYLFLCVCA